MRVVEVARREDAISDKHHILVDLLDLLAVIVALIHLRFSERDEALLRFEIVADLPSLIRFPPIDHDRRTAVQFFQRIGLADF